MADAAKYIVDYASAIEAFNQRGSLDEYLALVASDCTLDSPNSGAITGVEALRKAYQAGRDAGWSSHNIISATAAGRFLTISFRNDYTNGPSTAHAAVFHYTEDGKIDYAKVFNE